MKHDLSLVPLQDLYEEILNRFDHIVIVGLKIKKDEKQISRRWKGDSWKVMGLCADASQLIGNSIKDEQEEIKTDEL